ncbi:MAG: hypothetical protein NZ585_11645 [Chloracidobacterium sp.]|nr:hypothetical protein [Chloracidobacterium sp.]MDW8218278.1 hypothetical protein [Acidobacteriota bacterium]
MKNGVRCRRLAWLVGLALLSACRSAPPPPPPPELFTLIERFLPQFDGARAHARQPPLTREEAERLLTDGRIEQRWRLENEREVLTAVATVRFGKGEGQCRIMVAALPGQATVHSVTFQLSNLTDPALADDENHVIDAFVRRYGDPSDVDVPDIDLVWRLAEGALVLLSAEADDPTMTFALRPLSESPVDDALGDGGELRDHD